MAIWFHSAVLATTLAASAAIGIAGAAVYSDHTDISGKSDRLPIAARCDGACAPLPADGFITVEARADGVSVLTRVRVTSRQ